MHAPQTPIIKPVLPELFCARYFFFSAGLICYIYMVSYVVCGFHEAKFTSLLHVWACFFKVAIAWMQMTCSCYIILGLVKSCVQISTSRGTWAQGDGESGIPQLKKTPRESQSWDSFLVFLEQLLPKRLICSADAWLWKHWSYIALATCKRCQWPPNMIWYLCSCDLPKSKVDHGL